MTSDAYIIEKIDRQRARKNRGQRLSPKCVAFQQAALELAQEQDDAFLVAECCKIAKRHQRFPLKPKDQAEAEWAKVQGRAA